MTAETAFTELMRESLPGIDLGGLMAAMPDFAIEAAAGCLARATVSGRKYLEPWTPPALAHGAVRYDYRHGLRISATVPIETHIRVYDGDNPLYCPLDTTVPAGGAISYETPEKHFMRWTLEVNGKTAPFSLAGRSVLIRMRADTLGDAIYWLTSLERFKQEHRCRLSAAVPDHVVPLFQRSRPDVEWLTQKQALERYHTFTAVYRIGVYENPDNPYEAAPYRCNSLISHAQMILGQPLDDTPPALDLSAPRYRDRGYIAMCASASGKKKTWPLENYSRLSVLLTLAGWDVVAVGDGPCPDAAIDETGRRPLQEIVDILKDAAFYIGGPSGVYALAWASRVPLVMISGFTAPPVEAHTPYRVYPRTGCRFCWSARPDASLAVTEEDCPVWEQARKAAHFNRPRPHCPPAAPRECLSNMTVAMALNEINRLIADYRLTPGSVR